VARILVLSKGAGSATSVADLLPALELLTHEAHVAAADAQALTLSGRFDVIILDARRDLAVARQMCRLFGASGNQVPLLLVLTEGGFATVTPEWGASDLIWEDAPPAELEARLRQLTASDSDDGLLQAGPLTIDESAYHATLEGEVLDLTYTEFELLKYLAAHPGRVFSREQLLSDVWGYDYFGGTRTVDVHVRRLRAKLGTEHEALIGTVRNVGYRFSPMTARRP